MSIEDLRKYKIYKMAIFDLVMTFLFMFFIHLYMWRNIPDNQKKNRNYIQYIVSLILLLITSLGLGVIMHYITGVNSALSTYLGLNNSKL